VQAWEHGVVRLPHRAPREVYRLYSEEEYLSSVGCEETAPLSVAALDTTDTRLRRMLGAALLLGTIGAVGTLVALDSLSQPRVAGRRLAAVRPRPVTGTPVVAPSDANAEAGTGVEARTLPAAVTRHRARALLIAGAKPQHSRRRSAISASVRSTRTGTVTGPRASAVTGPSSQRRLSTSAAPASRRTQPVEFGFEQ
jgi:hypothetical protein